MYHCDLTDAEIAAAIWQLLEDTTGTSSTLAPQGVHENTITGYPLTADNDLLDFNVGNDTAFMPTLTTSMGTFATQLNYSHMVSNQF